ncbi:YdbH domain-containing protein [Hypericibacter adhaerens]|uniref:YdbH domain-containing protein n=1 Tax=Hypericibacter adhaerens TaxID=2602016 RepID=UPI00177E1B8A|nr:YdbH domain-containing protein [Hypericibacter adhaerens]
MLAGAAAALVTGAFVALLLLSLLPRLVEGWAAQQLEARGLTNLRFHVASVGWHEARITDIDLPGDAHLRLSQIQLVYGWQGFSPQIRSILVQNPRIEFTTQTPLDQAIASLGDSFSAPAAGGGVLRLPGLPPVEIRGGEVVLAPPDGPPVARLGFTGRLDPAGDDRYAVDFVVTGAGPQGQLAGRADGSLDLTGSGSLRISFADGRLDSPEHGLTAQHIAGEAYLSLIAFEPWAGTVAVTADQARFRDLPPSRLKLQVDRDPNRTLVSAEAVGGDGSFRVSGQGTVELDGATPSADGQVALDADADSPIWKTLGLPPPSGGRITISGPASVTLSGQPQGAEAPPIAGVAAQLELRLDNVRWPGVVDSVSGGGPVTVTFGPNHLLAVKTPSPLVLTTLFAPALLDRLALPASLRRPFDMPAALSLSSPEGLTLQGNETGAQTLDGDLLIQLGGAQPASLRLGGTVHTAPDGGGIADFELQRIEGQAEGWPVTEAGASLWLDRVSFSGQLSGRPDQFTGNLRVSPQLSEIKTSSANIKNLSLEVNNAIQYTDNTLTLSIPEPGSAELGGFTALARLESRKAVRFAIRPAKDRPLLVARWQPEGLSLDYGVRTGPLALALRPVAKTDTEPIDLRWGASGFYGHWSAAEGATGEIRVADLVADLPKRGIVVENLDARLAYAGMTGAKLTATAGRLRLGADQDWLPALAMEGTAELRRDAVEFDLAAHDQNKLLQFAFSGIHDLAHGRGAGRLEMTPVRFLPGGLQPRDLAPTLRNQIDEATGTVMVAGALAWKGGAVFSNLDMRLQDLSLSGRGMALSRINGAVTLSNLQPIATPPGQQIAVAQIDMGVPLQNALISFSAGPGPILKIEKASLDLADGQVTVGPTRLDPTASRQQVDLQVRNVDLGELLALAEIDGLSGTGRLAGTIPVQIEDGAVIIAGARLDATGPGRLAYSPTAPPSGLSAAGDTGSLVLSALNDFRYDQLWLTLDRDKDGEATLGLHVRGKNPSFYNGYPIELNLALNGRLDRILHDSLEGYSVPDLVREKMAAPP